MGAIDIIILAVVVLAAVVGAVKGFINQAGTVVGFVCAVLACRFFGGDVADYIVNEGSEYAAIYRVLIYVLVFAAVFIGVKLLVGLFAKALSVLHIRILDRVAGALFSMAAWVLVMSLVLNIYLAIVPADRGKFSNPEKPWRTAVAKFAPTLMGYI